MIVFFILGLILGGFAVVFALQNVMVVTVTFLSWQIQGSLALILAITILTGIAIALLMVLPELITNYFENRKLAKENIRLTEELRKQKELVAFAKRTPASDEAIKKIEDGAISSTKV